MKKLLKTSPILSKIDYSKTLLVKHADNFRPVYANLCKSCIRRFHEKYQWYFYYFIDNKLIKPRFSWFRHFQGTDLSVYGKILWENKNGVT